MKLAVSLSTAHGCPCMAQDSSVINVQLVQSKPPIFCHATIPGCFQRSLGVKYMLTTSLISILLVLIEAYSKYPCMHPTDFAHFGYQHSNCLDYATCFSSEEYKAWCQREWHHPTHWCTLPSSHSHKWGSGALGPNVQTGPPKIISPTSVPRTEFLIQYRRTY